MKLLQNLWEKDAKEFSQSNLDKTKSEARSAKFKTNTNVQKTRTPNVAPFRKFGFLNLLRVLNFEFRIYIKEILHLVLNEKLYFYLLILTLPTQLGKHFWPSFSYVLGQRVDYLSPTLYVTDILVGILLVFSLLKQKIRLHPFFLFTILYLSISIFFSQNVMAGWYWLVKFLEFSFLVWYIARVSFRGNEETEKSPPRGFLASLEMTNAFGLTTVVSIIGESLLAILQFFHQGSLGGLFYFLGERTFTSNTPGIANASLGGQLVLRPYATFSHPNALAGYLMVGMLLVLYFYSSSSFTLSFWGGAKRRLQNQGISDSGQVLRQAQAKKVFPERAERVEGFIIILTILIGTIALFLTLSRVAILLWIGIGVLWAFWKLFQKKAKQSVITLALVGIALAVFSPLLFYRFSFWGESAVEREQLAQSALSMVAAHPLFGVGPNNFISSLPYFSKDSFVLQPVHNIVLLVVSETGIIGEIITLSFLGLLLKKIKTTWEKSNSAERTHFLPLLVALCSMVFLGMFDHYWLTLQQGQLLLAVTLGFVLRFAGT